MAVDPVVSNSPIKVDVWSDIACPWCFIGKRKLEEGIRRSGQDVVVEYHSFELSPDTPVDFDGSVADFLAGHKRMPEHSVRQMLDRVTGIASDVGLNYDFERVQHTNTVKAHQLLHFAKARGVQGEMKERLLRAYFEEGRHVGHVADLADLAAEVGLDRAEVVTALEEDRHLADVRADQQQAQAYGIQGVPFFVIDGAYGVSGAQDPTVFESAFERVLAERAGAAS